MNRSKISNKLFSWPRALRTIVKHEKCRGAEYSQQMQSRASYPHLELCRNASATNTERDRQDRQKAAHHRSPRVRGHPHPLSTIRHVKPCHPICMNNLYDWSMHITTYRIAPRCARNCPPSCGQGSPICHHSHPSHQSPPRPDGKDPPTFIHMLCEWDTACVVLKVKNTCLKVQPTICGASSKM
jgi:hypothetical protein